MTTWIVLTPPGVEVEVKTSAAITEPLLVSDAQIQAVALAAATMLEAGMEVDAGKLLAQMCGPRRDPAQQQLQLEPEGQAFQTDPEDTLVWACGCGKAYTLRTGGELALRRHQSQCPVGDPNAKTAIPADRRVDQ